MKKANGPGWLIFSTIVKLFSFFYGQRIPKKLKIKGPALVLSNHTSFYDFLYSMSATYPRRVNFLAAKKMFYEPVLRFFLTHGKVIPKALLEADPAATVQSLKVIKNNGILGIFPEGQIAPTGVTLPVNPAIIKLIKKAGVPVYLIKHHNAYFANPPWTKKTYKGRIKTTVDILFSADDVKTYSEDELFKQFNNAFYHDPYAYNKLHNYKYRVRNISGLENLIYIVSNMSKRRNDYET